MEWIECCKERVVHDLVAELPRKECGADTSDRAGPVRRTGRPMCGQPRANVRLSLGFLSAISPSPWPVVRFFRKRIDSVRTHVRAHPRAIATNFGVGRAQAVVFRSTKRPGRRRDISSPVLSRRAVPRGDPTPDSGKERNPGGERNPNPSDGPLTMNAVVVGKPSQLPPSGSGDTGLNPGGDIEDGHRDQENHTPRAKPWVDPAVA